MNKVWIILTRKGEQVKLSGGGKIHCYSTSGAAVGALKNHVKWKGGSLDDFMIVEYIKGKEFLVK